MKNVFDADKVSLVRASHAREIAYAPAQPSGFAVPELHLLDYWHVLLARRWTIGAVLLTIFFGAMIWTYTQTPIYRASISIQIDHENSNLLNFKDPYQADDSASDDVLRTQIEILRSRSIAQAVAQELNLQDTPQFQPAPPTLMQRTLASVSSMIFRKAPTNEVSSDSDTSDNDEQLRSVVDQYLSRLAVSPVNRARLINVTFESEDPQLAARILNAHAKAFIEQNLESKYQATVVAQDFLSRQLVSLKGNLENAEDRQQAY